MHSTYIRIHQTPVCQEIGANLHISSDPETHRTLRFPPCQDVGANLHIFSEPANSQISTVSGNEVRIFMFPFRKLDMKFGIEVSYDVSTTKTSPKYVLFSCDSIISTSRILRCIRTGLCCYHLSPHGRHTQTHMDMFMCPYSPPKPRLHRWDDCHYPDLSYVEPIYLPSCSFTWNKFSTCPCKQLTLGTKLVGWQSLEI